MLSEFYPVENRLWRNNFTDQGNTHTSSRFVRKTRFHNNLEHTFTVQSGVACDDSHRWKKDKPPDRVFRLLLLISVSISFRRKRQTRHSRCQNSVHTKACSTEWTLATLAVLRPCKVERNSALMQDTPKVKQCQPVIQVDSLKCCVTSWGENVLILFLVLSVASAWLPHWLNEIKGWDAVYCRLNVTYYELLTSTFDVNIKCVPLSLVRWYYELNQLRHIILADKWRLPSAHIWTLPSC